MIVTSLWPVLSHPGDCWKMLLVRLVLIALKDPSQLSLRRGSESAHPTRQLVNKCTYTQQRGAKYYFGSVGRLTDTPVTTKSSCLSLLFIPQATAAAAATLSN